VLLGKVGPHLCPVVEEVADDRVDIGQVERWVSEYDLLWGRTFAKGLDDRRERDSGALDAQDAVCIGDDRNGLTLCRCQGDTFSSSRGSYQL